MPVLSQHPLAQLEEEQRGVHVPLTQVSAVPQACPQLPQLALSVLVVVQDPPQSV